MTGMRGNEEFLIISLEFKIFFNYYAASETKHYNPIHFMFEILKSGEFLHLTVLWRN